MSQTPNILLITVDDGGAYFRWRRAFGEVLRIPNLDRIEAVSTSFTSAYCQAPICGPSRNSMLSGLSPHQTGMIDNYALMFEHLRPEQLWQYRLKQKGYYCSTAGKVHHGFRPLPRAFHDILYSHPPHPLSFGPPRTSPVKRYGGLTGGAGSTDPSEDALYYDHQSASDAVQFLQTYDGDAPFYREVGFHHPHIPLKTPAAFKDMYDEKAFNAPKDWADGFDLASYPDRYMAENMDLRDLDFWRKSVRNYFSAYSHVDSHIGRVWDALQASPHKQNTILIFTSDHGYHLGDKNRMRKFTLWEESCRAPLIIHDPRTEPRMIGDPVGLIDIGPTVMDYCAAPPIGGSPGVSLRPMISGASDPDRAVPTFLYGNSSMRKGKYRITLYQSGESEFHDVDADPWLNNNLAGKVPEHEIWRSELARVCQAHGLALPEGEQKAAPFQASFIGSSSRHLPGNLGAIGNLDDERRDCTPALPGHRVHFSTLDRSGSAPLPNAFQRMHYGADSGGGVESFNVYGNSQDNEFLFPGSGRRFHLTIHPGPGRNRTSIQKDDLVVYSSTGDDEVSVGGGAAVIFGGAGRLEVNNAGGRLRVEGGLGDLHLKASAGPLEVISGSGDNHIDGGTSQSHITLAAGRSWVTLHNDLVTLELRRTGLPQTISGFCGGTLDFSDWATLGRPRLLQDGDDCLILCASECVRFVATPVATLRDAVSGVTLAEGDEA